MPDVVAKITHEDGSEESFGPMSVPKSAAKEISSILRPLEDERQQQQAAERVSEIEAETARRSAAAEAANRARAERGQAGDDPDKETK